MKRKLHKIIPALFVTGALTIPMPGIGKELLDLDRKPEAGNEVGVVNFPAIQRFNTELSFRHVYQKDKYTHIIALTENYCDKEDVEKTVRRLVFLFKAVADGFNIKGHAKGKNVLLMTMCAKGEGAIKTTNGIALQIASTSLVKINSRTGDGAKDAERADGSNVVKKEIVYPVRAVMLESSIVDYPVVRAEEKYQESKDLTAKLRKLIADEEPGMIESLIETAYQKRLEAKK